MGDGGPASKPAQGLRGRWAGAESPRTRLPAPCSQFDASACFVFCVYQDAVRTHFLLKRAHILKTTRGWLEEAKASDTRGHYDALKQQVDALKVELRKLGPSPCDAYEEAEAPPPPPEPVEIDPAKIQQVLSILPFVTKDQAAAAISGADGDVQNAINQLLSNM